MDDNYEQNQAAAHEAEMEANASAAAEADAQAAQAEAEIAEDREKRKTVGIIAYGWVGKAMAKLFLHNPDYRVLVHTKSPEKYAAEAGQRLEFVSLEEINKRCHLAIICAPTNPLPDGNADTELVDRFARELTTPLILIKSTVPPGTTKRLKEETGKSICMSPEYFGESKYDQKEEWQNPVKWPFLIVGGEKKTAQAIMDVFSPIMGPEKRFFVTDETTAEVVKYAENLWGATKVIWANEFRRICEAMGINFYEMRELWAQDPRVDRMHTIAFEDAPGFAGKCYPKDLLAMIRAAEKAGYDPRFLKEVWLSNKRLRKEPETYGIK